MDEVGRTRRAAGDAVADIDPERLRAVIDDRLAAGSMLPGVLTILSARVVDGNPDRDAVDRRAAGVQLIYEGLRLTRTLVDDDPWGGVEGIAVDTDRDGPDVDLPADLDVLAADVLVARGFRLLARTEAADTAVETVRAFGREESEREAESGTRRLDLEANVFELAAIAGASAAGGEVPLPLRQYVVGLARSQTGRAPPLPTAADLLPEAVEDVMARVSTAPAGDEGVRPQSAGDL